MTLLTRVLATVLTINLFSLAVFVALAALQYDAIVSGLTRERLVVLVDTVRTPFQAIADLGVPIGTMRNADAVLERARSSDDSILAIHVVGSDGSISNTTETFTPPALAEAVLDTAGSAGPSSNWHVEGRDTYIVGANVVGLSGKSAGSVVIEYSKRDANTQARAMQARLVLMAGGVFLISALLVFAMVRIALSEHVRIFDGILECYDRFERRFWRGSTLGATQERNIRGLGLSTAEFSDLMERSETRYQQAKLRHNGPKDMIDE